MSDDPKPGPKDPREGFLEEISDKAARKLKAERDGPRGVWFGLGMTGLVGWSVAVPTVAGALLGLWIDHHHPGPRSWTLMLLVAGLALGCFNAWRWVAQENKSMGDEPDSKDE